MRRTSLTKKKQPSPQKASTDGSKHASKEPPSKKPYQPPSMKQLGELKDITLATTNTTVT
jgi:hypothetical protein